MASLPQQGKMDELYGKIAAFLFRFLGYNKRQKKGIGKAHKIFRRFLPYS